jgi:hypothetical protein
MQQERKWANQRGDTSVLITVIVLFLVLVSSTMVALLLSRLLRATTNIEHATQAFYAADSGMEHLRWSAMAEQNGVSQDLLPEAGDTFNIPVPESTQTDLGEADSATYEVEKRSVDISAIPPSLCLRTRGEFHGANRRLQAESAQGACP